MMQRLHSLPRDTRDTLFLLLVVACCIAPLVAHIPPWASVLGALLLLWRGALAWRLHPLPSRPVIWLLLLAVTGFTLASFRTIVGPDAGVTLVVMLLALKTLELRARRDAMVVFFLGFFTLLSNFLFSQALGVALMMLLALLGLLTALVNAHRPAGRPSLASSLAAAARMALLGAPIMLALFVFFPRFAPLWGVPGDDTTGRSGLSGQMSVGAIAQLALDDSVALRVRFHTPGGEPPPQSALYFRGPVLSAFNGRDWYALLQPEARTLGWAIPAPAELQVQGEPVRYEMTMEASRRPWLLTLDVPAEPPQLPQGMRAQMTPELQWVTLRPVTSVLRYEAASYLRFRHGPRERTPMLRPYLQLPPDSDPRTRALAQSMRAELGGGAQALVDAALQRLRSGGYRYTLEPGAYGQNTADTFWFDRKEGFCEHIASAFVVLMRALDIPARIVTGYQGGEMNPLDGYWTVRQSDAHAWTEVWMQERGWVRVDPTGAVAPGRIGTLQRLQAPRGAFGTALGAVISPSMLQRLRSVWEALDNRWTQWVLNYTQERQLDLLKRLGLRDPDWRDLVRVLGLLAAAAALAGAAWVLRERYRLDPWQRLMQELHRHLRRAHLALPEHLPARTMARHLREAAGADAEPLADWLLRLERARYGAAPEEASPAELRRALRRLPWGALRQPRRPGAARPENGG
ncbi:transglutaminase TgpA family protein [Comamonas flocculans]|uniref:DUF3488 domain-containing protein n=1 Tax=Comamonas flocculans TaxID=2597701 RepID=A0A5B8RRK0_9BURK|nr:DUF3488 and transglutaminase-like domain-containing protein [Comamonas flocculans]QEA11643.1 DUF3488 domain-containing protein [Comamonas flocculans]